MRVIAALLCFGSCQALADGAQNDPYHLTETEKAACTDDAMRLCSNTYPDERKLVVCMKTNRAFLSASCLPVFEAGLKKRHL